MSKPTLLLFLKPSGVTLFSVANSDEINQTIGECTWKDFEGSSIENPIASKLEKRVHLVLHPELTYLFSVKLAQSASNSPDVLKKVVESKVPEPPKELVWGYRPKTTEAKKDGAVTMDVFAPVLQFWKPLYQLLKERQVAVGSVYPLLTNENKIDNQTLVKTLAEKPFSLVLPEQSQSTDINKNQIVAIQRFQKQKTMFSKPILFVIISTLAISVSALIVWYVFK